MNKKELQFVLQEGEGLKIEFKTSLDKSLAKEMAAFANSSGGRVFLGIDDSGNVKGVNITNRLKSQVQDIAKNCEPSIDVKVKSSEYGDDKVLIIDVPEGLNKPYSHSGVFYLRSGASTQKMKREQLFQFLSNIGVTFELPRAQVEAQVELSGNEQKILRLCSSKPLSSGELADKLGHVTLSGSDKRSISKLADLRFLERTIPDKPRSKMQKYIAGSKGIDYLRKFKGR